jgi:hypothetical protein
MACSAAQLPLATHSLRTPPAESHAVRPSGGSQSLQLAGITKRGSVIWTCNSTRSTVPAPSRLPFTRIGMPPFLERGPLPLIASHHHGSSVPSLRWRQLSVRPRLAMCSPGTYEQSRPGSALEKPLSCASAGDQLPGRSYLVGYGASILKCRHQSHFSAFSCTPLLFSCMPRVSAASPP